VDEVICATTPEPFLGVGRWYEDFSQMTDEEVRELLERVWRDQESRVHVS
jgi:predicted phosphoribosyltransferase